MDRNEITRRRIRRRVSVVGAIVVALAALAFAIWWLLAHQATSPKDALSDPVAAIQRARPQPPVPDAQPQLYKPLTAQEAATENAAIPFSTAPIEVARPMHLPTDGLPFAARRAAIDCLTAAVYYEGATESVEGQRAIAQVVLNRVRHPAFPDTVCGVVYQGAERRTGCQFTFACDGSLARQPSRAGWEAANRIAIAALAGAVEPRVGMATHYHADYVVPYWASSLDKIAKLGVHIFYRWHGSWGRRAAFTEQLAPESDDMGDADVAPQMAFDPAQEVAAPGGPIVLPPPESRLLADNPKVILAGQGTLNRAISTAPQPTTSEGAASAPAAPSAPATLQADRESGRLKIDGPPVDAPPR